MKKRLSIFIYSLASGGAERVVSILLVELCEIYDITLVLMSDKIFYDLPKNINIVHLEDSNPDEHGMMKFLKLPWLGMRYKKICRDNDIDISLSFMNRPNYINIFSRFFGAASVCIVSQRVAILQEYKTNSPKDTISKYLIKLYRYADVVIANSKYMQYELKRYFNLKNTKVVYNPVGKNTIQKKKKDGTFVFVHVGRMEEQKNHKLLIEAFNALDIDAQLWLIGDGYLRDELEKIANKNIKFLGRQKNVFEFLSQADCFVFGSNYEGFPNVLLEALSCGLPVISTDCKSGPREILAPDTDFKNQTQSIEKGEFGILTKVGSVEYMQEAMNLIYSNVVLRQNYEQRAIIRVKEFEVKKIVKSYKELLCAE